MHMKLDEEVIRLLACPLCKGDLWRSDECFRCEICGLVFPRKSVRIGENEWESVFDFRIHRPEYCTPMGCKLWMDGQREYERWSERLQSSDRIEQYLGEIDSVREIYTNEYHVSGRVLDVGGHQGRLRHYLQEDVTLYVSIDPSIGVFEDIESQPNLTSAYPCLVEPCNFIAAHAEHLPFQARSFDWIHMRSVLDHFADPYLALVEAFRCCRTGGKLLVGIAILERIGGGGGSRTLNGSSKQNLWRQAVAKLRKEGSRSFMKALLARLVSGNQDHHTFHLRYGELHDLLIRTGWSISREHWQKAPYEYCAYISCEAQAPSASAASNPSSQDSLSVVIDR